MYHVELHIEGVRHFLTDKGIKHENDCTNVEADEHHYKIKQFGTHESAVAAYYATQCNYPAFVCSGNTKHHISL